MDVIDAAVTEAVEIRIMKIVVVTKIVAAMKTAVAIITAVVIIVAVDAITPDAAAVKEIVFIEKVLQLDIAKAIISVLEKVVSPATAVELCLVKQKAAAQQFPILMDAAVVASN